MRELIQVRGYFWVLALAITLLGPLADAKAQEFAVEDSAVRFGGFLDSYYAYDATYPNSHVRPYTTQATYSNGPRLNQGMLDAKLNGEAWRGRVAFQYGDSVRSNYATEPDEWWRYVQEGTVGYKIAEGFWFDAGIYLSHLGFEGFNSKDNWTYTRSLVAEYSPYYESGAKVTYSLASELTVQIHLLHGWQNISDDQNLAFGSQISYALDERTQLTYGNFLGEQKGFRNFHDFIVSRVINDDLRVALQVDIGNQNLTEDGGNVWWHGWALLAKYSLCSDVSLGARIERFSDPHGVLVTAPTGESFSATGLSINFDYEFSKGLVWRTEYKALISERDLFPKSNGLDLSKNDQLVVTSIAYAFDLGGI